MQIDKIKFIDFHSHILPGIDDGSDSVETSKEMLCSLKEQGEIRRKGRRIRKK